jgi:hypothetical protein
LRSLDRGRITRSSVEAALCESLEKVARLKSGKIEAISVHHLDPRRCEVLHKLLARLRARINFGKGAQLGVRTEEVDTGAGPLQLAALTVVPLENVFI